MAKVVNFETRCRDNEHSDRLIKRFVKKTSKVGLVRDQLDNMHFVSDSEKKRLKKKRKLKLARKFNIENN